jgi:hypothetical protein
MDSDIWKIICDLVLNLNLKNKDFMLSLNERYLHHYFSYQFQDKFKNSLNLKSKIDLELHPEWPTYKESTNIKCGRYKRNKVDKKYIPHSEGTAGFIDFAFGKYNKPIIGLEFSLKFGWSKEEITYDFVKLLDKENPFESSFSLNLILREKKIVKGNNLAKFEEAIENARIDAAERLEIGPSCNPGNKKVCFIIAEIDCDNDRQIWCNEGKCIFSQNNHFSKCSNCKNHF